MSTLGANIADFNESLNLHTEEPFGVRRIPGKGMRGLGGSGGDTNISEVEVACPFTRVIRLFVFPSIKMILSNPNGRQSG